MNLSAGRRTWEEAASPAAVHLARKYEQAWRDSDPAGRRPNLQVFLGEAGDVSDGPGARLALLRADMALRWETGERVSAQWYLERYPELGEDTIVALVYEEYCLREEDDERPDAAEYLARYPGVSTALARVLQIHDLVGSGTSLSVSPNSCAEAGTSGGAVFPEAGQTIGGFSLVEELGRGAFARVFLAKERQLADRPVALKVTRRGSREPQTLARLQHTHIVPVYSHRIDAASGLHLLCMPYFGRVTLARVLADKEVQSATTGHVLALALQRLEPGGLATSPHSAGREALEKRTYPQAIAWWGAKLAEALDHAHDRGVLHRDIKPSNVLVTADGMPMLLDFNLAREPVFEDELPGGEPTLGGTIDYMPREQLKALAEGCSELVDCRADIYSLGVVLFEALTGKRPFASPRRGGSMVDLLNRAADLRLRPLAPLRDRHPEIPDAFETVIRRCLEPEPNDRYQRAGQLAADLQAVADDLPLLYTREPWPGRAAAWLRRRRRRIATAATILFAMSALLAGGIGLRMEQMTLRRQAGDEFKRGEDAIDRSDFSAAQVHFGTAVDFATRSMATPWSYLSGMKGISQIGGQLKTKIADLKEELRPEELITQAGAKAQVAERKENKRREADELFEAADHLRFQLLLDEGSELTQATVELQRVLKPFFVLENPDWTKLEHMMALLDDDRRGRIVNDVNELLFLWMARIDESAGDSVQLSAKSGPVNEDLMAPALDICRKALVWVEPKAPWQALEARLRASRTLGAGSKGKEDDRGRSTRFSEPREVNEVDSPLDCFQWGVLAYRAGRLSRAIEWLERASRLERGKNYWHQFLLGYLEDKAGQADDAFRNYSIACSLRSESPWVLFSRARIYRVLGKWDWAREDIGSALEKLKGKPEATQVRLALAYLYQQVGDFTRARTECDLVIAADGSGIFGRAARLNRANMDGESGAIEKARKEYDALILEDLTDTAALTSRALLELRLGQAERARIDLTSLLEAKTGIKNRHDVLAARALALLLLGRSAEAVADATESQRLKPSPGHERMRQRALLAARQPESLQLDRPEDVLLLPVGGKKLTVDLDAAEQALEKSIQARPDSTLRATLNRAVLLAALGRRREALEAATRALRASPQSPRAYLIRARVNYFGGARARASEDVERGLRVQPNDPGLLELRGILQAASGDLAAAVESYNQAVHWGAFDRIHLHKAAALEGLGQDLAAVREWTLAMRRDPELPEAYLGQARLAIRLKFWDLALADLEQAAAWASSDPPTELAITAAYLKCLPSKPNRLARWLALAIRTYGDFRMTIFR
jgi:serine/threonine protein kinase/Flp pilus assembly protein TadD